MGLLFRLWSKTRAMIICVEGFALAQPGGRIAVFNSPKLAVAKLTLLVV